jgi:hypothetical protein
MQKKTLQLEAKEGKRMPIKISEEAVICQLSDLSICCPARGDGGCLSTFLPTRLDDSQEDVGKFVSYVQRCRKTLSSEKDVRGGKICQMVHDCVMSSERNKNGKVTNEYQYIVPPLDFQNGHRHKVTVCRPAYCFIYGISYWEFRNAVETNNEFGGTEHVATAIGVKRYTDSVVHPYTYSKVREVIEQNLGPGTAGDML